MPSPVDLANWLAKDPEKIRSFADAARALGVSPPTVKRWALAQGLEHHFRSRKKAVSSPASGSPITLRRVAEASGYSTATVSLALRNSPRVSPEAGEAIRRMARNLGYEPHPYVQAHMRAIRHGKPARVREVIAMLYHDGRPPQEQQDPTQGLNVRLQALQQRARELGYEVTLYNVAAMSGREADVTRQLKRSGVEGVLLDVPSYALDSLALPYERFRILSFRQVPGHSLPLLLNDAYRNQLEAFCRLWQAGYRRICRVHFYHRSLESLYEGNAAFLLAQQMLCRDGEGIPILQYETMTDALDHYAQCGSWKEAPQHVPGMTWLRAQPWQLLPDQPKSWYRQILLKAWHRTWKPDVYISLDDRIEPALKGMGLRVPEDVGLVHLDASMQAQPWTGIRARDALQGRLAVERLVELLNRSPNESEEQAWKVRVPGCWQEEGSTSARPSRTMTGQQQAFVDMILSASAATEVASD